MQEEISFGIWLRKQRRALDLTRQAFADQIGCAEVTLRRIEVGTLKPSKELAGILLEKLGIPETERPQWISFARGLSDFPLRLTPSSNKPITNLPAPITTFIGREKEQSEVIRLITKHRLVTLTGPGGVGKTRLSLRVGEQVLEHYADGVWLVELAPILDPLLITHTVAFTLGLRNDPQRHIMDMLCDYLRERRMLLVLDNCEHVLDACAQLIDVILKTCPQLKILATSREPLNMTGEAIYRVPSLGLPNQQQILDTFRNYESIQLFEERAQLVQFDFSLTLENAAAVAQICQRLDGIPLAIELAAAKVAVFSTEQIAKQLHDSFNLLTGGSRTALPRHQTLHASMNWSWGLLTESEQTLMRQLSVFAGGWTLESAQEIFDGDVLILMSALVKKSLIVANQETGGETRSRFHEIVRQYMREKLLEAGQEEAIRTRHLQYFLQLADQAEAGLSGSQQVEWMSLLNDERANIRVALEWADQTDLEAGLCLSGRLYRFWESFDIREGAYWLAKLIENPESKVYAHVRAKALFAQGRLLTWLEQFSQARSATQASLDVFRVCGDRQGEIDSLLLLGYLSDATEKTELSEQSLALARSLGDVWRQAEALYQLSWIYSGDKQMACLEQAIILFRQCGDWSRLVLALSKFGNSVMLNGDIALAQQILDEAARLSDQLNDKDARSVVLSTLGRMAIIEGAYDQARRYLQEAIELWEELGTRMTVLWCRCHLGYLASCEGNLIEAGIIFAETAREFFNDKSEIGVVFTLEGMAGLFIAVGKPERAAQLIGWSDATRKKIGDLRPPLEQADVDKLIADCITKMGKAAFSDTYEEGNKLTLDEAVEYALKN